MTANAPLAAFYQHRIRLGSPQSALRDPHIPENRRGELESPLDVLAVRRRLDPFSPRDIGDLVEGNLLHLIGDLLALRRVGRAHPVRRELVELRDVGPTEPGV